MQYYKAFISKVLKEHWYLTYQEADTTWFQGFTQFPQGSGSI